MQHQLFQSFFKPFNLAAFIELLKQLLTNKMSHKAKYIPSKSLLILTEKRKTKK